MYNQLELNTLWQIYHENMPEFIETLSNSKAMERIKNVGMNCGCEYTHFPSFVHLMPYSRYTHSVGVALITYHFSHDINASIAGLFHDIASPVFSHVIDFLNKDYLNQESTEANTSLIIQEDKDIMNYLNNHSIQANEIDDYHIYPIADNDSPKLSADRLEYSLGNLLNYQDYSYDTIQRIYQDLLVGINEYNEQEIMFQTKEIALLFGNGVIQLSHLYISDADCYAMESLAILIREAINRNILTRDDLYTTESKVIHKLINSEMKKDWEIYCNKSNVYHSDHGLKIYAKKRMIDPYIINHGRLSTLDDSYKKQLDELKNLSFDYYLEAK